MATKMQRARNARADLGYARKAKRWGMQNSLRIAMEARAAGLKAYEGFALVQQESYNGANVFGHDPSIYSGAGKVTKAKYLAYKRARGRTRMQGVGPLQLTWWELQDAADAIGGCWVIKYNLRTGFRHMAQLRKSYGHFDGTRRYNGSGPAAVAYAKSVAAHENEWHRRLYGK